MHPVDREAMTVAMALVPAMYSRNKLFALHREPEVQRAKARAAMIRGVVRQLAGTHGEPTGITVTRQGEGIVLRFRLPQVRFERRVDLTEIEHALVVYLASRAGVRGLTESHEDRARIDAALMRLGADVAPTLVAELRARQSDWPPHP